MALGTSTVDGGGNTHSNLSPSELQALRDAHSMISQGLGLASGHGSFQFSGNDTITLGSGRDTIAELGGATALGGAASHHFQGGYANDSILAGSGYTTILGGSGNDTFVGASGHTPMGNDSFIGGKGFDTVDTSSAHSTVFTFDSAHGGAQMISNFTHSGGNDKVHLVHYDTTSSTPPTGSGTTIHLGEKTTVTLTNFTHPSSTDFK